MANAPVNVCFVKDSVEKVENSAALQNWRIGIDIFDRLKLPL